MSVRGLRVGLLPLRGVARRYATVAKPTTPQASTGPRIQPTTFSEKSAPRQVHERPEKLRGMGPSSGQFWAKPGEGAGSNSGGGPGRPGPAAEQFGGPSRPRLVYDRPGERELPKLKARWPLYLGFGLAGVGAWAAFVLWATNAERLASSVLRQVTFQLRNSAEVAAALGDNVRLEDSVGGFGPPWISGSINNMQGRVDLSFRVTGSHGAGTVYFTSIRPKQEGAWRIVRYKIITDSGETVRLEDRV